MIATKVLGGCVAVLGVALFLWVGVFAETRGVVFSLEVNVLGDFWVPAMLPMLASFSMAAIGLVVAYKKRTTQ